MPVLAHLLQRKRKNIFVLNKLLTFSGGYPYLSLTKNSAYNLGFNSTQAGIVSLLGNAALALGGITYLQFS